MIGGSVLREGSNNAFEREDWIRIGYENGEWNGWCVERSVGWNTMHVFPYVRCLPILDKNTLTNIADIGRESVHDINKIRARRTGTRTKTRILVFLRLCFIFFLFFFGITIPSFDSFDNLFFFLHSYERIREISRLGVAPYRRRNKEERSANEA